MNLKQPIKNSILFKRLQKAVEKLAIALADDDEEVVIEVDDIRVTAKHGKLINKGIKKP